jgi:hypothetical protein
MTSVTDLAGELFGPGSAVPWWAWLALLVMIFWGLLVPEQEDRRPGRGR